MKKILLVIAVIILFASCEHNNNERNATYTYECIDKKEAVGSHYDFITNTQVVGSEYYIILKDRVTGKIISHEVSLRDYYNYNIGASYTFTHELLY